MSVGGRSSGGRSGGCDILIVALLLGIMVQLVYLTNRRGGLSGSSLVPGAASFATTTGGAESAARAMAAAAIRGSGAGSSGNKALTVSSILDRERKFAARMGREFNAKATALLAKNYEGDKDKIIVMDVNKGMYLWDWFIPLAPCAHKERVGTIGDGGKWVCDMARYELMPADRPCVVYSFGVRDDSSFEAEMHERTHCDIFAFDMTVDGVAGAAATLPRVTFWKMGLGAAKGEKNGLPITSLAEIMKKYGHTFIDVLKIDVEYSEVDIIPELMKNPDPPFEQLLLEVHHVCSSAVPSITAAASIPHCHQPPPPPT